MTNSISNAAIALRQRTGSHLRQALPALAACVFVYAAQANAAPSIGGVTGAVQQDGTITISGSGFGTGKTTALVWDDFEGGADGTPLKTPKLGTWALNPAPTTFTTAQSHSGSKSAYSQRTPSSQWGNFNVDVPDGVRFYQSFWFRYNYPAGDTGQAKLVQIHGTYGVGDYNPGIMTGGMAGSWWASYLALENSGMYNRVSYPATYPGVDPAHPNGDNPPSMNTWHHAELILKQSSPNVADGSVVIKIDGADVYRQDPTKTREISGQRWNLAEFFTGMTNFTAATNTWIDDVYLNDSWARVEIGDNASYAATTHRELVMPTAWSDTSITARMNAGSFPANQKVYVFVTDSNGVTSPGYPVTIGTSSSTPAPTLAAPTGLRVMP